MPAPRFVASTVWARTTGAPSTSAMIWHHRSLLEPPPRITYSPIRWPVASSTPFIARRNS